MVISAEEKKILLARLEKARETKAAKAAAAKAAKAPKETPASVKEPEPPAPAPVAVPPPAPAPAPAPVDEKPPASDPIDIPVVPDLVAASKRKPAKKTKKVESSDDDSDDSDSAVLPPKRGAKKQAYMKIKIYKEPKNAAAFQSLIEAVQDEQPEEEPVPEERVSGRSYSVGEPAPAPASASIGRSCRFANANANNMAMKKGAGVISAQELMRRAALEFFS